MFKCLNVFGFWFLWDKLNNICDVENILLFIDDIIEDNIIKFMMIVVVVIFVWLNKFIKGEIVGLIMFYGVIDIIIIKDSI